MDRLALGIGRAMTPRRLSPICLALLIALAALLPADALAAPAPAAPTISLDPAHRYALPAGAVATFVLRP
jgi:hypothetical protein